MSFDPIDLTRRFISIPSFSGEEGEFGRFLVPILEDAGLSVTVQPVAAGRFNLLARAPGDPEVVLCTHLDTVPPFVPLREDAEWIWGRGACDTKGILAAMITAAERLVGEGVKRFGLLLVVGEETDSLGARTANERLDWPTRYLVVGEPTGSRFARGQKGALKVEIVARGKAAHSAYPERGESALLKILPIVQDLYAAEWGRSPNLGEGTVNVGELHAGHRPNIIPGEARATVMVRIVDSVAEAEARLRKVVDGRAEIRVMQGNEAQTAHVPPGEESVVVAFNTDIPWLTRFGKCLLIGPGSIEDAHGDGERIAKRDVLAAVGTYTDLVRRLLAQPA